MLILFIGGAAASTVGRHRSLAVACTAMATVLIVAQTLLTYQATAGWHYIEIYPYVVIVCAYGGWVLLSTVIRHRRQLIAGLVIAALAVCAYDAQLFDKYARALNREPVFEPWSPAIYKLSAYLQHTPGRIYVADWGIFTPLLALHPSHRFVDLEFALTNSTPANLAAIDGGVVHTWDKAGGHAPDP